MSPDNSRNKSRASRDWLASHPGSQHVDLAARQERVEAVLDQPTDGQQASQRPPPADHVEVDVGAVAGDDVAKVARSYRASPWPASDQSSTPLISSPSMNTWVICRSPCMNTGVHGRNAAS